MFATAAGAYDRLRGRWSRFLSPGMADRARVRPGTRALDVGRGLGALLAELVARIGAGNVAGVDRSEPFVAAARERHPGVDVRLAAAERLPFPDDVLAGVREGHLAELFVAAGLDALEPSSLTVELEHPDFEAWWQPFTEGVGPAGAYLARLDPPDRAALREACRAMLPDGPFALAARAWAARGIVAPARSGSAVAEEGREAGQDQVGG